MHRPLRFFCAGSNRQLARALKQDLRMRLRHRVVTYSQLSSAPFGGLWVSAVIFLRLGLHHRDAENVSVNAETNQTKTLPGIEKNSRTSYNVAPGGKGF